MLGFNMSPFQPRAERGEYLHPDYQLMLDRLDVQCLRYPGGTLANFWNWNEQYLDDVLVKKYNRESLYPILNQQLSAGSMTRVNIKSYFDVCIQKGIQPIIVLPLYTQNADYCIRVVDSVKASYTGAVYWEMGNELHFPKYADDYAGDYEWSVDHYATESSKIISYIRSAYPEDKTAVCLHTVNTDYNVSWKAVVKDIDSHAFTQHLYINKPTLQESLDMIDHLHSIAKQHIEDIGKPMWVTEAGVLSFPQNWQKTYLLGMLRKKFAAISDVWCWHLLQAGDDGKNEALTSEYETNANSAAYDLTAINHA